MGRGRNLVPLAVAPAVAAAGAGTWFYRSFIKRRVEALARGVWVVSGGGGNTLVLARGDEIVVVDTKFGPGSASLVRWIDSEVGGPVTTIVNTHFHYDHTQGNTLFPEAEIWAHERVPDLMWSRDGHWWRGREPGVPHQLVADAGRVLSVAGTDVELHHPGPAHTHGDLFVHLPAEAIVATGDLLFHTYYPFFDVGDGGAVLWPLIATVRRLAGEYPQATFVPGHGPPARPADLHRYADYLERLAGVAERVSKGGMSRVEGVRAVRAASPDLSVLPSFHNNRLSWATPVSDLTWCGHLVASRS